MDKIDRLFDSYGINDRLTKLKHHYALELLKNEFIKLAIIFALFFFLDSIAEYLFAVLFLLPVRIFSGGMHMKTNVSCFVYSLSFFVLTVKVLPLVALPHLVFFSLVVLSIILLAIFSPVASHKRPIKTKERYYSMKKKTILFLIIDCILLVVLWKLRLTDFLVIGVWVITLQATQVVLAQIIRYLKGVKDAKTINEMETDGGGSFSA